MGLATLSGMFTGLVTRNNFVGNGYLPPASNCGMRHGGASASAPDNYWGSATGPGPDPADLACGSLTATPFATKPFAVKAPVKP